MARPIQIRTASQGELGAFLQLQREKEGKAARVKSARDREWQSRYDESDLEWEAWEQAAAQLLDEGRDLFGSEAAAQMEFDRIVKRRAKTSSQQTYSEDASWTPTSEEKSRAFFLALRQAVPPILLFVLVGLPVASLVDIASSWPMTAALAGIVWYVHSRMMGNIREMRPAEEA